MKYLLAIAVGPVQDFIAAARRTSDLTAGSALLVRIAGATARAVRENGELIFPAAGADGEPSDGPNKIVVALNEGADPRTVAADAKAAARAVLRNDWHSAKGEVMRSYKLNEPLADAQIESFLEFYAAWVPYTDADYRMAREQADALLAGRKNLRDFGNPPDGVAPRNIRAKSPLDPAFECVLNEMPAPPRKDELDDEESRRNPLHLTQTEFLDAVSLLKRVHGQRLGRGGVPSTRDLARGTAPGAYQGDWSDKDDTPEPYPYFAVLTADGDGIGKLLNTMATPDAHRDFSRKLAAFARDAKAVIARHDGYAVYTGGDDILAFLPVKTAVACAKALATLFAASLSTPSSSATLSAGIAVAHYRQPLALSLDAARGAEKSAKDAGRDSLCLALHTRGGRPLTIARKWAAWDTFETWLGAFAGGNLSRGVAYELRTLADEFAAVPMPPGVLAGEAKRIWCRKETTGTRPPFPDGVASDPETLRGFADLLIAARFLTASPTEEK